MVVGGLHMRGARCSFPLESFGIRQISIRLRAVLVNVGHIKKPLRRPTSFVL